MELVGKLDKYIHKSELINMNDILDICQIISSFYDGKIIYNGIQELESHPYPISYQFDSFKIRIVYESLKNQITSIYRIQKFDKYINFNIYFNSSVILYLIHEFRHSMQSYEIKESTNLGKLYKKSIEFLEKTQLKSALIYYAIYQNFHEHFIIEINANYYAFVTLLSILEELNEESYEFFYYAFIDKIKHEYEFDEYVDFHDLLIDDIEEIEELKKKLDIKEQILNGIYRPNPDSEDIKMLIL